MLPEEEDEGIVDCFGERRDERELLVQKKEALA
jgi:hypothetical protein